MVIRDFVGVVALREEQAVKAAQDAESHLESLESKKLPDMDDVEQAIRDNPRVQRVVLTRGNVEQALAQASERMPRTYLWPYQIHGRYGWSLLWVWRIISQSRYGCGLARKPHLLRADLAWLLEYPEERIEDVRMEAAGVGGAHCADDVCADALLLSRAVCLPVRVQLTREQEHVWEPKARRS